MLYSTYPQIQQFLNYLKYEKRYSRHTVIAYQNDIEQFFVFITDAFASPPIEEITANFIKTWLAELKKTEITPKSINRKLSTLKSFFKYLLIQKDIQKNPATSVLTQKTNKRLPAFIEQADIETLLKQIELPDDWRGKTDRLVIHMLYNTGLRLSELVNLKTFQVDTSYRQIKILGKGNKERIIPLSNALLAELQAYIQEKAASSQDNEHLFTLKNGKPIYHKYVYNTVKKYLGLITTQQKKSPHVIRHTFATHLMNKGADLNAVKELLGHSSLAATQIYTHTTIEKLKEVFQKSHPKA